jgi:hypothetical protein
MNPADSYVLFFMIAMILGLGLFVCGVMVTTLLKGWGPEANLQVILSAKLQEYEREKLERDNWEGPLNRE